MRYENLGVGNLQADVITGAGIELFSRRKIYLDPTAGSDGNDGLAITKGKKTLAAALDKISTGKSDTIILVQGTSGLSLGADPAWSYNMTRLIGNAPPGMMNMRSRIGMSTAFSPFITVSGYGNLFANLYTMHGTAAADYIGWLISGSRNVFKNVHFGGPMNADQGGHASYEGVKITGQENYFDHCVFGTETIERDETTPNVTLGPGTHTIFEDCVFLLMAADTDPYFVKFTNSSAVTHADFKRCRFIAMSSNMAVTPAVALKFSGGATALATFDAECQFINVTAITVAGSYGYVWVPPGAATDKLKSVILS